MTDTVTPNLGLLLPQIYPGDQWGGKLNANFTAIDVFAGGGADPTGARSFGTAAEVLADVDLTYTPGTALTVVAGQYVLTESEGFSYKVAAAAATDQHVTTAGGVKLYVLQSSGGFDVAAFGAVGNGTDQTAVINLAILTAYKSSKVVSSPAGEAYSISVRFDGGVDYKVNGPILLPSGIVLDGQGCRIIGQYGSAMTAAYDNSLPSIIETGYYNGTGIVTNRAAGATVQRVVGSGIQNFAFTNANCAINAINLQETSFIKNCRFTNVSAAMRLTSCFYLRVEQHVVRQSSQATGQSAIHLIGGNHNAMLFQQVALVGPSIGILVNGPASFASVIDSCTFEEGKSYSSTGILFGTDAYCGGWQITNNYVEGVRYGVSLDSGANVYGAVIDANIFNNNEYAIICSGPAALRMTSIRGNSLPDDGGTDRNLVEVSNANNDVVLQVPTKIGKTSTGTNGFLSNFTLGNAGSVEASSVWVNDSALLQAIGKAQPAMANQNKLNAMPFEGANIVSLQNQVPFVNLTTAVDTLTIDTAIAFDLSNVLVFNFYGTTFDITFDLKGFIFGTTLSWVTKTPAGVVATVSNNGGFVRLVFTNLTASTGVINTTGMIRHA